MISFLGSDISVSVAMREERIQQLLPLRTPGSVYVQTCNRVELYTGVGIATSETVLHLFRVAAGLESAMVGEGHILGQIKRAYLQACEMGKLDRGMHKLFLHAIRVGKRVRTQTAIARGAVSHASATLNIITCKEAISLDSIILVLGANTITRNVCDGLQKRGYTSVFIANRTESKAHEIAHTTGCTVVDFEHVFSFLAMSKVVVSALKLETALFTLGDFPVQRCIGIDLSVPRTINTQNASEYPHYVYDLDEVEKCMNQNLACRCFEVLRAEELIDEEINAYRASMIRGNRYATHCHA